MVADKWEDYEIIASGAGEKLERWGEIFLLRPDPQAIWPAKTHLSAYKNLHAHYLRSSSGGGDWKFIKNTPTEWKIKYKDLQFLIKPTGFKHVGLFPEQSFNWDCMANIISGSKKPLSVLNLFAYTGGASVASAKAGAKVTHVDSAKGMNERAKQNADLNGVSDKIRFITDDCFKFVLREIKRGNRYDAVIMDPPSYGRGPNGETWKLEDNLFSLVNLCVNVLNNEPAFFLINSYTTGLQPTVINNILALCLSGKAGSHAGYELCLPTKEKILMPCGCSGLWVNADYKSCVKEGFWKAN